MTVVCDSRSLGRCFECRTRNECRCSGYGNPERFAVAVGDLRRPQLPSVKTGSVGVWIARVQRSSSNVRWRPERSSNPSYPRFRGIVHQFVSTPVEPSDRVKARDSRLVWGMDPLGFEPRASSLQRRCSTAELRAQLALVVLKCLSGVDRAHHGRTVQLV